MAGRKPRPVPEAWQGVPRGNRRALSGLDEDGNWTPVHPGQRPPFMPGNTAAVTHGGTSARAVALAQDLVTAVLEDPAMPPHLRSPAFRATLVAWGRVQALADMMYPWMANLELEEMTAPQGKIGNGKSRLELYLMAETKASNLRARLGLDPVSYAKIAKDLGVAQNSSEAAIERLARKGAEIVSRRGELEAGGAAD